MLNLVLVFSHLEKENVISFYKQRILQELLFPWNRSQRHDARQNHVTVVIAPPVTHLQPKPYFCLRNVRSQHQQHHQ